MLCGMLRDVGCQPPMSSFIIQAVIVALLVEVAVRGRDPAGSTERLQFHFHHPDLAATESSGVVRMPVPPWFIESVQRIYHGQWQFVTWNTIVRYRRLHRGDDDPVRDDDVSSWVVERRLR